MSDDEAPAPDAAPAPMPPGPPSGWRPVWLVLAFLAPCAAIAIGLGVIVKSGARREAALSASATDGGLALPASSDAQPGVADAASALAAALGSAPALSKPQPADGDFDEEGSDEKPTPAKRAPPKHFATVQEAAAGSCSTETVDGLSRQIIEQVRCLEPNAFAPLPKRANLVLSPHVYPYLELAARDHLAKALLEHPAETMTVNSALRTVAQQYLVYRWAASKSCGVQLATPPGESNHEIGSALDIAEAAKWRPALEAQDFHWLGRSDRVHFDFKGTGVTPHKATDVLAFQKLWNRNHPTDVIAENGQYGPATEQKLKKAPTGGFPKGASCAAKMRTR